MVVGTVLVIFTIGLFVSFADADGEKIFPRFVKYKDPSTDRIYWSFVPDDILTADEGMAWKFQLEEKEYENLDGEA